MTARTDRIAHEPVDRPLRVFGAEILLTLGQAYLVGVTFYISTDLWGSYPAAIVISILALAAGAGYLAWLLGSDGRLMAVTNLLLLALLGSWFLVALFDSLTSGAALIETAGPRGLVGLALATAAAVVGAVCGIFLPGPRRRRWHHRAHPPSARPAGPVALSTVSMTVPTALLRRRTAPARAAAAAAIEVEPQSAQEVDERTNENERWDDPYAPDDGLFGAGPGALTPVAGTPLDPPSPESEPAVEPEAARGPDEALESPPTPKPSARARKSKKKAPPNPDSGSAA